MPYDLTVPWNVRPTIIHHPPTTSGQPMVKLRIVLVIELDRELRKGSRTERLNSETILCVHNEQARPECLVVNYRFLWERFHGLWEFVLGLRFSDDRCYRQSP